MRKIQTYKLFVEQQLEIDFPDLKKPELDEWLDKAISIIYRDCQPFIKYVRKEFANNPIITYKDRTKYQNEMESPALWRGIENLSKDSYILPELQVERDTSKIAPNITFTGGSIPRDIYRMGKKLVRKDRVGKDMPEEMTHFFNVEFLKHFEFAPRSEGIFCTGKKSIADGYGWPFLVFPIGEFEYIWSEKVNDLFDYVESSMWFDYTFDTDGVIQDIRDGFYPSHAISWYEEEMSDEDIKDKMDQIVDINIKNIVDTYKDTDLREALVSGNEITLKCDEYYILSYHPKILQHFYNGQIKDKKPIDKSQDF